MNIYAKEGAKVVYSGMNGYPGDHETLKELGVKVGDTLTVDCVVIGSWHSSVQFKEIKGLHNSVIFEDV